MIFIGMGTENFSKTEYHLSFVLLRFLLIVMIVSCHGAGGIGLYHGKDIIMKSEVFWGQGSHHLGSYQRQPVWSGGGTPVGILFPGGGG